MTRDIIAAIDGAIDEFNFAMPDAMHWIPTWDEYEPVVWPPDGVVEQLLLEGWDGYAATAYRERLFSNPVDSVRAGILSVNEARRYLGLGPAPGVNPWLATRRELTDRLVFPDVPGVVDYTLYADTSAFDAAMREPRRLMFGYDLEPEAYRLLASYQRLGPRPFAPLGAHVTDLEGNVLAYTDQLTGQIGSWNGIPVHTDPSLPQRFAVLIVDDDVRPILPFPVGLDRTLRDWYTEALAPLTAAVERMGRTFEQHLRGIAAAAGLLRRVPASRSLPLPPVPNGAAYTRRQRARRKRRR